MNAKIIRAAICITMEIVNIFLALLIRLSLPQGLFDIMITGF